MTSPAGPLGLVHQKPQSRRESTMVSQKTCLVVAMYENNAQVGWFQLAAVLYCHIVPLTDVIDVDGDAGISAWREEDKSLNVNCCNTHPIKNVKSITKQSAMPILGLLGALKILDYTTEWKRY